MGDLNKLTFSKFPGVWRNDRGGLRKNFFLVTDVMNSHAIIVVRWSSVCMLTLACV